MSAVAQAPAKGPKVEYFQTNNLGPVFFGLMIAAGISLAILAGGSFLLDKKQVLFSLLYGFSFCFTICAGSLFWILVHHATDAEWSVVVRRILETMATSFRYIWVFFLPIAIGASTIYLWMDIAPGKDTILDGKRGMLNVPFWMTRAALIFFIFWGISHMLRTWSTAQDKDGDPKYTVFTRRLVFPSIVLFALGITFGAIDWLKGLDHYWFSTMWGVYIFAGSAWAAMATLIITTVTLKKAGYLEGIVNEEHFHIMGKLQLAFTVFWAYIGFGQYFLIWYANIPEETSYFIRRNTEGWNVLSTMLVVCHFFIPFLLLLWQPAKRNLSYMRGVAIYVLCVHALDHYIIVLPALHWSGVEFRSLFTDLAAVVLIASTLIFFFLKNLTKFPLYPLRDPRLKQSLNLKN